MSEYDALYQDATPPPWEIGRTQPALEELVDGGLAGSRVLDVACGSGELALLLAARVYDVTGVDSSRVALELAARKARERGRDVVLELADALDLPARPPGPLRRRAGLRAAAQPRYGRSRHLRIRPAAGLSPGCLRPCPGGVPGSGPRVGLTEDGMRDTFGAGWRDTTVEPAEVAAQLNDPITLAAWLLTTRRDRS